MNFDHINGVVPADQKLDKFDFCFFPDSDWMVDGEKTDDLFHLLLDLLVPSNFFLKIDCFEKTPLN